jgi:hypothetical protein
MKTVFWEITLCSLVGPYQNLYENLLPPEYIYLCDYHYQAQIYSCEGVYQ